MKILITLLVSINIYAGLFPNFRTVHKDNLYRSAQLSGKQFKKYIKKYNIKTIINLRGESSKDWYRDEIDAANEMGVEHYSLKMRAKRYPHQKDLRRLLELYENAPRPILIHCHGGADRTGEASAIYKMEYMGASKKKALRMLTVWYRHLKFRFPAKRHFIKKTYKGRDWAMNEYDPCNTKYKYYNQDKECSKE